MTRNLVFRRASLAAMVAALAMLVLSLAAIGCGGSDTTTTSAVTTEPATTDTTLATTAATVVSPSGEPWKIGVILHLNGPIATIDEFTNMGLKAALDEINAAGGIHGRPVEIVVEDAQSDPTITVSAARKVSEDKSVIGVIGPSFTTFALAAIPVYEENEIPNLALGAGRQIVDPLKKWIFKIPLTDSQVASRMAEYMNSLGIKKFAVLHQDDASGVSGNEQMVLQAAKYGMEIVAEETFNAKDTDMRSQLLRIQNSGAEAISAWGGAPPGAVIAKNYKQLGMKQMFLGQGMMGAEWLGLVGDAGEGFRFFCSEVYAADNLAPDNPVRVLYERLKPLVPGKIDGFVGNGYDSLMLFATAIEAAGPDATRATVRDALEQIKNKQLLLGYFTFSATEHNGLSDASLIRVITKNGQFVPDK